MSRRKLCWWSRIAEGWPGRCVEPVSRGSDFCERHGREAAEGYAELLRMTAERQARERGR